MKKLLLSTLIIWNFQLHAQLRYCDSAVYLSQKQFSAINASFNKFKGFHSTANTLHVAGAWFQVVAITGYKTDYFNELQYKRLAFGSLGLNLAAIVIDRYAILKVNKLKIKGNGIILKLN